MSRIDSLTQIRVRLTHVTTQVSPTSLERIRQAWAGVPMQSVGCSAQHTVPCQFAPRLALDLHHRPHDVIWAKTHGHAS
jgi:hypothetical protein